MLPFVTTRSEQRQPALDLARNAVKCNGERPLSSGKSTYLACAVGFFFPRRWCLGHASCCSEASLTKRKQGNVGAPSCGTATSRSEHCCSVKIEGQRAIHLLFYFIRKYRFVAPSVALRTFSNTCRYKINMHMAVIRPECLKILFFASDASTSSAASASTFHRLFFSWY